MFRIPDFWWLDYCKAANGYFGSEDIVGEDGEVAGTS